ncbi:hypothetical protein [Hymenobacter cellulosilyticus]|uniref:Uncharacterized protein n=1 Tax=Hymenobacter cellulosilyticus TaxID=2932248 RepID=A0A8T9QAP1_9BACT|nr:hypothetical protein [Hymenobacter cellulosilyticus]UOQ73461.1 hypothetical protein MUN79_05840 [Hymenobacter cellulosilyticus]
MDNWPIALVLALALAGSGFVYFRSLSPGYEDGKYRRHLTKQEQADLQRGEIVEKIHKSNPAILRSYYDEGPLRVLPAADGKYTFVPYGKWKRLTRTGRLVADFNPSRSYQESYWHEYHPNGQRYYSIYTVPAVLEGDTVEEMRSVFFSFENPTDTAYVQHTFSKNNQEVRKGFISFDAQGKKPVPPGWKPSR